MKNQFDYPRLLIKERPENHDDFFIRKKKLHDYELHWHDYFEIELILSGTAIHELNGIKYHLSPGDIYLLNPTDFHSIKSNDAEVYNIMFSENLLDDELLQKILSVKNNLAFHLDKSEFRRVTALIEQILFEFNSDDNYSADYIKNLLECLFITFLRKCDFSSAPIMDSTSAQIRKAILYIHGHFRENPSMQMVAKISGFNKNYFSTLFHKSTGKTYTEYISVLKLEHSKKLILSGELAISEICFASGFSSLPNFLRSFKSYFKLSPGEMRRAHLKSLQKL